MSKRKGNRSGGKGRRPAGPAAPPVVDGGHVRVERPLRAVPRERPAPDVLFDQMALAPLPEVAAPEVAAPEVATPEVTAPVDAAPEVDRPRGDRPRGRRTPRRRARGPGAQAGRTGAER